MGEVSTRALENEEYRFEGFASGATPARTPVQCENFFSSFVCSLRTILWLFPSTPEKRRESKGGRLNLAAERSKNPDVSLRCNFFLRYTKRGSFRLKQKKSFERQIIPKRRGGKEEIFL